MFIPGTLISTLTFPGVMLHEYAHYKACQWRGVPVGEVCLFRFGDPAGYVTHAEPTEYTDTFWINFAPLLVNTLVGLAVAFTIAIATEIYNGGTPLGIFGWLLGWLGLSFGMQAFPSSTDAENVWNHAKRVGFGTSVTLVTLPVVIAIKIANILRVIWFDFFYAGFLSMVAFGTVTTIVG